MQLPAHGANPKQLYDALNIEIKSPLIDFSENTNPYGIPSFLTKQWEKLQPLIGQYPEPHSETIVQVLAQKHQVKKEHIIVGNGATQCIYLLAHFLQRKRVLIVEPTFTEYKKALRLYGCDVKTVTLREEDEFSCSFEELKKEAQHVDAIFICYPNNPTGVLYERTELIQFLKTMNEQKKYVILDEAFIDFVMKDASIIPMIHSFDSVIVLRSLTKIFHLAGVRIGYIVSCNQETIEGIKKWQEPWSVNKIAQQLGIFCLNQEEFIDGVKKKIAKERESMFSFFKEYNIPFIQSETNYYLMKAPIGKSTNELFFYLLNEGIVPRHTYNFQGLDGEYIRLAVKRKEENERLKQALRSFLT